MDPSARQYPRLLPIGKRDDRASCPGARRPAGQRGFTLVEAMMATLIFVMFTLGIYGLILESYNMTARIRYRDNARALLLTFADQFERLQTTTQIGSGGLSYARWLFTRSDGPTGLGLKLGALCDEDAFNNPLPNPVPGWLDVTLGGDKAPIPAKVTREVHYVVATGASSGTTTNALAGTSMSAAGWMIVGKFTISYVANGRPESASITVVRSVP